MEIEKNLEYFEGIIGKKAIITLKDGKTISGKIDIVLYDIETYETESITVINQNELKQVFLKDIESISVI